VLFSTELDGTRRSVASLPDCLVEPVGDLVDQVSGILTPVFSVLTPETELPCLID
jgi:hypothetical protein